MSARWTDDSPSHAGLSNEQALASMLDDNPVLTPDEAKPFFTDFSTDAVGRKMRRIKNPYTTKARGAAAPPKSIKPICDDQPVIEGDTLVLSDLHIPFHDAKFIKNCVDLAVRWEVKNCVINGDLIDVEAFSKWVGDPENTFEEELAQCEDMLNYLSVNFERVVWTLGNHERRFLGVAAKRQVRSSRFLRMITDAENVEISSFEWSEIRTVKGTYIAVHPMSSSVISGRVPQQIAARRFTWAHVIGAHGHLRGMTRTEDGRRWAIDSGGCFDPKRIAYSTKSVSIRPVMNQGAVVLKNGYPYPVEPQTDWDAITRMYA